MAISDLAPWLIIRCRRRPEVGGHVRQPEVEAQRDLSHWQAPGRLTVGMTRQPGAWRKMPGEKLLGS